eukprot:TRINITY_DN4380_c5_g1_i1.p1 TRINITY_DN4380_c5_g1~~TRINITY_DN4380_c5_g1_i1.p1  ORF type:complete len:612 (+),score=146.96 TRINITY_DN4380_c5_g1_i1:78-1838(+)
MLTPRFWCSQDFNFVIVTIKLLHAKISEVQMDVDGCKFTFHSTPYFLRLTFDQEIVDDTSAKATYCVEQEEMIVQIPKKQKGETFTSLDCPTKLLTTEKQRRRLVEEIPPRHADPTTGAGGEQDGSDAGSGDESSMDFEYQQEEPRVEPAPAGEYYGFNDQFQNFFAPLQNELEIVDVANVDSTPLAERVCAMQEQERQQFLKGAEHYLADFADDAEVRELLGGPPPPYYAPGVDPPRWGQLQGLGGMPRGGAEPQLPRAAAAAAPSDSDSQESEADEMQCDRTPDDAGPAAAEAVPSYATPGDIGRSVGAPADEVVLSGGGLGGWYVSHLATEHAAPGDAPASPRRAPDWPVLEREEERCSGVEEQIPPRLEPPPQTGPAAAAWRQPAPTAWEREELLRLPRKRYLVADEPPVAAGLADLLCAFCYDWITTAGEGNAESSWTIAKLSPSLSHVVKLPSMRHVAVCFLRRVMCFPLHRHWALAQRCLHDAAHILSQGDCLRVARCLLYVKWHLDRDEFRYPLSKLYAAPYATWVQSVSPDSLRRWGAQLAAAAATVSKSDVGLPLLELEEVAAGAEEADSPPPEPA